MPRPIRLSATAVVKGVGVRLGQRRASFVPSSACGMRHRYDIRASSRQSGMTTPATRISGHGMALRRQPRAGASASVAAARSTAARNSLPVTEWPAKAKRSNGARSSSEATATNARARSGRYAQAWTSLRSPG